MLIELVGVGLRGERENKKSHIRGCTKVTKLGCNPSLFVRKKRSQRAYSIRYLHRELVACLQKILGRRTEPHTRRRAREDDCARQQRC